MWWSFLNLLAALGFLNERQAKFQRPLENTDKGFYGDGVHALPALFAPAFFALAWFLFFLRAAFLRPFIRSRLVLLMPAPR